MSFPLDRYSYQAETLPTLLVIAPIALLIAALLPEGMSLKGLFLKFAPFIALAGLAFVASQIGADFGRRLEKRLWEKWDGPPTTRFLRHGNQEYNAITRQAVHESLRHLGLRVPTQDEEARNAEYADVCYAACATELRRLTRDRARFPLVHKRLIDYGFRRNMLGLRWLGLVTAAMVSLVCAFNFIWNWDAGGLNILVLTVGMISVGSVVAWLTLVNEGVAWLGADRYAHILLEAARNLE